MDLLVEATALEQAERVRRREVSCEELVRAHLERIGRLNADLGAFVRTFDASALRTARACDRRLLAPGSETLPPLFGVPIGIKDLELVRHSVTSFGSRAFRFLWSPVDGPAAQRLRRAGLVILGKLATAEFGALPVTEPALHAPARNPWNLDHTSGGSSGGSATAVAARLVPVAHATDGGGSIRIPASFCGLFGIKPSRGQLVSSYGPASTIGISAIGPIARSVEDAALVFDALAQGPPPGFAAEPGAWLSAARRAPPRLRIRFTTRSPACETQADVAAATFGMAETLRALGHDVEEGPVLEGTADEFLPIWQRQIAAVRVLAESRLEPVTRWLRAAGRSRTPEEVGERLRSLTQRIDGWFGDADLWLTPTVACAPPPVGAIRELPPEEAFRKLAVLGAFTVPFNVSGHPAASVPATVSERGLPIGVQIVGRRGRDDVVLQIARQIEEARPFAKLRPPIA